MSAYASVSVSILQRVLVINLTKREFSIGEKKIKEGRKSHLK